MTPAEKFAAHRPRQGQTVRYVDPDAKPPINGLGLIVRVEHDRAWVDYGITNDEGGPVLERFTWCFSSGLNSLHSWPTKHKCALCDAPALAELDGDSLCQAHADAWCRGEGAAEQVSA